MPITSSPRPITVNRSLSLPTYTCTTASYPCLPFLVTPCSSLSLPTAPYHSLPLSIPPTAFYHSPLCPIISNLFLSPPIAFYPSQPQRITPHRVLSLQTAYITVHRILSAPTASPPCSMLPVTSQRLHSLPAVSYHSLQLLSLSTASFHS